MPTKCSEVSSCKVTKCRKKFQGSEHFGKIQVFWLQEILKSVAQQTSIKSIKIFLFYYSVTWRLLLNFDKFSEIGYVAWGSALVHRRPNILSHSPSLFFCFCLLCMFFSSSSGFVFLVVCWWVGHVWLPQPNIRKKYTESLTIGNIYLFLFPTVLV